MTVNIFFKESVIVNIILKESVIVNIYIFNQLW